MVALQFLYVGLGMLVAGFLKSFGFSAAAKRMAYRLRMSYFRSTLRQDIGWHDEESTTEFTSALVRSLLCVPDAYYVQVVSAHKTTLDVSSSAITIAKSYRISYPDLFCCRLTPAENTKTPLASNLPTLSATSRAS